MILDSLPLYSIGTVARLTGVKADTLRAWERRYGLGASRKSPHGQRQYTQADVDHLQLIATLIADGARIGDIAAADRKTLEALTQTRTGNTAATTPPPRPLVVFVGTGLAAWLDEHGGSIGNARAVIARGSLSEALKVEELHSNARGADLLVVEVSALTKQAVKRVMECRTKLQATRVLVCTTRSADTTQPTDVREGITVVTGIPDTTRLHAEIGAAMAAREVRLGEANVSELVSVSAPRFTQDDLEHARTRKSNLACECPAHLSSLIDELSRFEQYSATCSVDSWQDAALHTRIYLYTARARELMEKALSAVLETHGELPDTDSNGR